MHIVLLYKVIVFNEFMNTEILILREMQGEVPTSIWSQHPKNGSIHNLVLHLFLLYIFDALKLNPWPITI